MKKFILILRGHVLIDWSYRGGPNKDKVRILVPYVENHDLRARVASRDGKPTWLDLSDTDKTIAINGASGNAAFTPNLDEHFTVDSMFIKLDTSRSKKFAQITLPRPHSIHPLFGRLVGAKQFLGEDSGHTCGAPASNSGSSRQRYVLREVTAWVYDCSSDQPPVIRSGRHTHRAIDLPSLFLMAISTADTGTHLLPGANSLLVNRLTNKNTSFRFMEKAVTEELLVCSKAKLNDVFGLEKDEKQKLAVEAFLKELPFFNILGGVESGSCDQGNYAP